MLLLAPSSSKTDTGCIVAHCCRLPPFTSWWLLQILSWLGFQRWLTTKHSIENPHGCKASTAASGRTDEGSDAAAQAAGYHQLLRPPVTPVWSCASLLLLPGRESHLLSLWHKDSYHLGCNSCAMTEQRQNKLASCSSEHGVHCWGH